MSERRELMSVLPEKWSLICSRRLFGVMAGDGDLGEKE